MEVPKLELSALTVADLFDDKPRYLRRGARKNQHKKTLALFHGETTVFTENAPGSVWRLEPPEGHPDSVVKKKMSLDTAHGTIYAMRREMTAPCITPEPLPVHEDYIGDSGNKAMSVDILKFKEKSYIRHSSVNLFNDKIDKMQFRTLIMKDYKKPYAEKTSTSYRAPHDGVTYMMNHIPDKVDDVVKSVVIPAKQEKIRTRKGQKVKRCKDQNIAECQFCEVLGPQTCYLCIEKTNRFIAKDVERNTLPEVDHTMVSLVAPNLSEVMKKRVAPEAQVSRAADNVQKHKDPSQKKTSFSLPPLTYQQSNDSMKTI